MSKQVKASCPVASRFIPSATGAHPEAFHWYRELRAMGPVVYQPDFDWFVVTRYEQVATVLRDSVTYSNRDSLGTEKPVPPEIRAEVGAEWSLDSTRLLNLTDPPTHTRLRKLMAPAFTARRMTAHEELVREIAHARIDSFADRCNADIAAEFAYRIPNRIIARVMGADEARAEHFVDALDHWMRMRFTEETSGEAVETWRMLAAQEQYSRRLVDDRRCMRKNDLTSDFVHAAGEDGEPALSDDEIVANMFGLFGAGSETSAIMMVNTLDLLLRAPEQYAEVCAHPDLVPAAIEEALRLRGPVRGLLRAATKDTVIDGVSIPKGARIYLCLASANHDEAVFEAPDKFDLHRPKQRDGHLAFGKWAHFCIGAGLARLEGRVALEALLKRLPNLRLAPGQGLLEYGDNPVLPTAKSLRLEWD